MLGQAVPDPHSEWSALNAPTKMLDQVGMTSPIRNIGASHEGNSLDVHEQSVT